MGVRVLGIAIWCLGEFVDLKVPLNAALGIPIAIAGAAIEVVARKRKY